MQLSRIPLLVPVFLMSISISSASLCAVSGDPLGKAAAMMKKRDYGGVRKTAEAAASAPGRDLLLGMAAFRMGKWDEAERKLAKAVDSFPLLVDYALYYRASALCRSERHGEALPLLERLLKEYPDSPLYRAASLLYADSLYRDGRFQPALDAYCGFSRSFPDGNDALKARYGAALCREKLGDREGAAAEFRALWLGYPNRDVARDAAADLKRLAAQGLSIKPYSAEELFDRGLLLFDLRKFGEAGAVFASLSPTNLPAELRGKLLFKAAMALHMSKRYPEAEQAFARLASPSPPYPGYALEAYYWHARTLERLGRDRDACDALLKLAETRPESDLADDALYQAGLIRIDNGSRNEARVLFDRLLKEYPASPLAARALWENGWDRYRAGDFPAAARYFGRLQDYPTHREKALYWKFRSHEASGTVDAAREALSLLAKEYPAGYYFLTLAREKGITGVATPFLDRNALAALPVPAGHERTKALIGLGLLDEARLEIAAGKGKDAAALDRAALFLAMEDYRSAIRLFGGQFPARTPDLPAMAWAVLYPTAYAPVVSAHSAKNRLNEHLTFSLIRAESAFFPEARSPVGALGLMQLMPATAKDTARRMGESVATARLTTPEINVRLGTRYLRSMLDRFNGNLVSAVAAYNAGPAPVVRWRKNNPTPREDEFIECIPYGETREYVKRVLAGMEIYRRLYGERETSPLTASTEASAPAQNAGR